jgi:multiple sugar transport system substrate-binding protein
MIGGPTGFAGSERHQYSADTPEDPAIEAAKKLKAFGVDRIVLGLSDGSIGQLAKPFPDGAPPIKDLWKKETGIKVDIVGVPNGQEFTKVMQDIAIKAGSFDIYAVEWNRLGEGSRRLRPRRRSPSRVSPPGCTRSATPSHDDRRCNENRGGGCG